MAEVIYKVELSEDEMETLTECLGELRKKIDYDFQSSHFTQKTEPIQDPIFIATSKLLFKLAKVKNPKSKVTLKDFLDYGTYGINN